MGDLILMSEHRRVAPEPYVPERSERAVVKALRWTHAVQPRVSFYFDVGCPFSYLAAERVERRFGSAVWIPTASAALHPDRWRATDPHVHAAARVAAELRAAELRLPLVWPDEFPLHAPTALRAAAYAAEVGAGERFALAAARLAFCGGFDPGVPDVIAEAAAAAGVPLGPCLAAAADESRDRRLYATSAWLHSLGVVELPAIRVAGRWFGGERALDGAMAAALAV